MQESLIRSFTLRKLTAIGLLVAVGTIAAPFSIPVGVARAYPVQHTINVLSGVLLGPIPAIVAAILTSTLRNLLGTGTPLAFPGSIFGALLAGLAFNYFKNDYLAAAGEVIGTGLIGALVSFPLAKWLFGFSGLAYFYIVPFALSSFVGSILALLILKSLKKGRYL
ncbi:MAG: energy coupling factor transporter S component ThiW [Dethiobacteria bacterium]|jgi:energy coupling factor transporter S component ThiW